MPTQQSCRCAPRRRAVTRPPSFVANASASGGRSDLRRNATKDVRFSWHVRICTCLSHGFQLHGGLPLHVGTLLGSGAEPFHRRRGVFTCAAQEVFFFFFVRFRVAAEQPSAATCACASHGRSGDGSCEFDRPRLRGGGMQWTADASMPPLLLVCVFVHMAMEEGDGKDDRPRDKRKRNGTVHELHGTMHPTNARTIKRCGRKERKADRPPMGEDAPFPRCKHCKWK